MGVLTLRRLCALLGSAALNCLASREALTPLRFCALLGSAAPNCLAP